MQSKRLLAAVFASVLVMASCGGGGSAPSPPPPPPIQVQLSASTLKVLPDGTTATLNVTVTRPAGTARSVTLSVLSLPSGVTAQVQSPGSTDTGSVSFTAQPIAGAGTHSVAILAGDGVSSGNATLSLVVEILATVGNTINTQAGINGRLDAFMSTSFQPASWSDDFFINHPGATAPLNDLKPQHIRVQALERDIPQTIAGTWNFSHLDDMMEPIMSAADKSPEFQIARGPSFMYDSMGNLPPGSYQDFATYCQRLVEYYNLGSFTDDQGVAHPNPNFDPKKFITWWGIYNEPNINRFTADQYVALYNMVVPAMLAADSSLRFAAVELADFDAEPQRYMPTFVSNVNTSVAPVDAVATHFYSTCDRRDTDQKLFDTVPAFADDVTYIYSQLQGKPNLATVPVWVTENNVNADFDQGNGISICTGLPFVEDQRGTSAFFAAWRPTVFSKLAQAGARALYHWGFAADAQYGEISAVTAQPYLSYWVDYWLARYFPSPPGSDILELNATDSRTVEILATRNPDRSTVVMVANHAVHSPSDNNGLGDPRTVVVDVSALGTFSAATLLTIDANTDPASGPSAVTLTPASRLEISLSGYGVSFLSLKP